MDAVIAVLRAWNGDEGWGVCSAEQFPGGCWVNFSAVDVPGFRRSTEGDSVWLVAEVGEQDGYGFRATRCWPVAASPELGAEQHTQVSSGAYVSQLDLYFDNDDTPVSR